MHVRHATSPESMETATTGELRERYLVDDLFVPGELRATYTHEDRMVLAGAVPVGDQTLTLETADPLRATHFLERRELGVVNVGEPGEVLVDDQPHKLGALDGMYIGLGRRVAFRGDGARFYLVSATAHADHGVTTFHRDDTTPVELGSQDGASLRHLYRYVWGPDGHPSCQLQLGVTVVADGSVWNTMPPHLHERRTEVYLYTQLAEDARVLHIMGQPGRTRHLWVRDGEAVISPRWSIHAGAGTGSYAFVWAMAGENTLYTDLEPVALEDL
ncbi:MAG TPA: 5-dehydro-4-deoxy-D-glucuronate isomerase [Egibacteraceae bacterium]